MGEKSIQDNYDYSNDPSALERKGYHNKKIKKFKIICTGIFILIIIIYELYLYFISDVQFIKGMFDYFLILFPIIVSVIGIGIVFHIVNYKLSKLTLDIKIYKNYIELPELKKIKDSIFFYPRKTDKIPLDYIEKILRDPYSSRLDFIITKKGKKKMNILYRYTEITMDKQIDDTNEFIIALRKTGKFDEKNYLTYGEYLDLMKR